MRTRLKVSRLVLAAIPILSLIHSLIHVIPLGVTVYRVGRFGPLVCGGDVVASPRAWLMARCSQDIPRPSFPSVPTNKYQ